MTDLQRDLQEIITLWRKTAEQAELAAAEVPNRFAQGHLCGLSVGLQNAARRIETLIEEDMVSSQLVRTRLELLNAG